MPTSATRKTLYLRGLPVKLVRDAKAEAARRGTTLTSYVESAIERSLEGGADSARSKDVLGPEMRWYERNRERLVAAHENEYVAIVGQSVLDHDRDFSALALRVFDRLGVGPVFMPLVSSRAEVIRIRSPRVRRA
jgi:hypothetical protein